MTPSFLDSVLRGAEALAARDPVGTLPDPELLRRFAADRDPAAFAVLVRRHGPLVWGVCRNLLQSDADAEDAFQATFLALVRSAATVQKPGALGGWLHGVAYRVAMKARRTAVRRKQREAIAATPEPDLPVSDSAWDELQSAVHEEVCRLPDKLRLPFVLCGLQGRPQKDAARQLGWTLGTLSGRLTLARQRLLDRLARRGVPVGVAAGAAVLGATTGSAALPTSIVLKAMSAAATPDAVSPVVTILARGVTHMYLTRTRMLVAGVVLAGILTTGIGTRLMSSADAQTPQVQAQLEERLLYLRALEQLKSKQQPKDHWEYKFVAAEKPMSAAELQKLLSSYDREGWQYCGSQNLAVGGKPVAHLTFKRETSKAADKTARMSAAEALAALAATQAGEASKEARAKLIDEALRQYGDLRDKSGDKAAAAALLDLERQYQKAFEAQRDAAAMRAKEAEAARAAEADARDRAAAERAKAMQAELKARQIAEAQARAGQQERVRAEALAQELQKALAEHDALLKKLKDLEKEKANAQKPAASSELVVFALKHVNATDAAKTLQKILPGIRMAAADERTNSILVQGTPETIAKVKELISKAIDVEPTKPAGGAGDKIIISVVPLKNINAKAAVAALEKAQGSAKASAEASSNSIILAGTANAVAAASKLIAELDAAAGKGK